MKITPSKLLFCLTSLVLILQACGAPPATEAPTQAPSAVPPPTDIPAPTAILHTVIPAALPASNAGIAADQDSARTSGDQSAGGGDRFTYGEYERPFNAATMDQYFPDLDITQYEVRQDGTWIYASITLRSRSPQGTFSGQYALEIDNDIDGKGDWLILVSVPSSTDWSVNNVQVWQDTNNDVGGNEPVNADKNPGFGDGYETKVFEGGVGSDVDAAWARISPDNPNVVQLAVKTALVDDDGKYLAGPWAGSKLDPAMFDFNDKMTQEQAGAAVKSFAYYPIQGLAQLDRACRIAIGIPASGDNLGLCQVYVPPVQGGDPSQPGQSGCTLTLAVCQSQSYCSVDTVKCECVVCG